MAFGATTIIWLSTTNIVVLTLSFVMAILVCVTRIESKKKRLSEVVFGALTGIAVIALLTKTVKTSYVFWLETIAFLSTFTAIIGFYFI